MFVSNLAPVLIVCSAALVRGSGEPLTGAEITQLLQCAMFAAGIGTCMQLYPIWKIGSRLPIVMGVSFTFLGSLLMICTNPELGYEGMIGAVILGGIFEGLVGLSAKYWKRFLTPVVSAAWSSPSVTPCCPSEWIPGAVVMVQKTSVPGIIY